jgi:hypothetical protein
VVTASVSQASNPHSLVRESLVTNWSLFGASQKASVVEENIDKKWSVYRISCLIRRTFSPNKCSQKSPHVFTQVLNPQEYLVDYRLRFIHHGVLWGCKYRTRITESFKTNYIYKKIPFPTSRRTICVSFVETILDRETPRGLFWESYGTYTVRKMLSVNITVSNFFFVVILGIKGQTIFFSSTPRLCRH